METINEELIKNLKNLNLKVFLLECGTSGRVSTALDTTNNNDIWCGSILISSLSELRKFFEINEKKVEDILNLINKKITKLYQADIFVITIMDEKKLFLNIKLFEKSNPAIKILKTNGNKTEAAVETLFYLNEFVEKNKK